MAPANVDERGQQLSGRLCPGPVGSPGEALGGRGWSQGVGFSCLGHPGSPLKATLTSHSQKLSVQVPLNYWPTVFLLVSGSC